MLKVEKHVRGIICGVFFIGMSIQIVLGVVWAAAGFTSLPVYPETSMYVEISKTFICDEYTGILYPVLLMLARGLAGFLPIRYYSVMYIVQLTVACYASHRFLRSCRVVCCERGTASVFWDIWCTLCLMTIPMAMQCHMAVLPNSLTLSFFMVMLSFVLEASGAPAALQARNLVKMAPLWLAASLLMPEYKYLAGVPILCLFVYSSIFLWKKDRRQIVRHTLVILAFMGMIAALGNMTQVPGSQGRMRKSLAGSMVSRFVWPNFQANYPAWPEEIRNIMTQEDAAAISLYADEVQKHFGPMIEEAVGEEHSRELYWEMVRAASQVRLRQIVRDTLWDAACYAAPPWMLERQLNGEGYESFSGRNYEIVTDRHPWLSVTYIRYGNRWFSAGMVLALVSLVGTYCMQRMRLKQEERSRKQKNFRVQLSMVLFLAVTFGAVVLYYTGAGAGIMDYKNAVFITILWYAWMLREATKRENRMLSASFMRLGKASCFSAGECEEL